MQVMSRIAVRFFVFILLSCSVIQVTSQPCHGMSQYSQCSTNSACGCLYKASSDNIAICG
ncbi:unnamed protein product, partial [Rotaria sp. Silwood2]